MKRILLIVAVVGFLAACNSSSSPAASPSAASASTKAPDAVTQKLQEHSGANAADCGRLDISATEVQLKTASDCAMQASQSKHAFYVAYDMPGMSVGVAGAADGSAIAGDGRDRGGDEQRLSGTTAGGFERPRHLLCPRRYGIDGKRPRRGYVGDGESARIGHSNATQP